MTHGDLSTRARRHWPQPLSMCGLHVNLTQNTERSWTVDRGCTRANPSSPTVSPNANDTAEGRPVTTATRPLSEQRPVPTYTRRPWHQPGPTLQPGPGLRTVPRRRRAPVGVGPLSCNILYNTFYFTSSYLCSERRGPQHTVEDSGLLVSTSPALHTAGCAPQQRCVYTAHMARECLLTS